MSYASNGTFQADGANSLLNVSALTTVTQQHGGWAIDATNGGKVNLSGMTTLTSTDGISITDTNGSTLLDPLVTTLSDVDVSLDGSDAKVANSWAKFFDSSLTVTIGTVSLPGLTDVDESGLHVNNGGNLTLLGVVSYSSDGTFQADGANSILDLSKLTTVTQQDGDWAIDATNGGTVDLSGLTNLTSTDGINIVDTSNSTQFDTSLATLNGVNLNTDGTDSQVLGAWSTFTNGTLSVSGGSLALPDLTGLAGSDIRLSNGATLSLADSPILTGTISITGAGTATLGGTPTVAGTVTVSSGSALNLPSGTSYSGSAATLRSEESGGSSTVTLAGTFAAFTGLGAAFSEALNAGSLVLGSYLSPVDLDVTNVMAPTTASAGQSIMVTWQTGNLTNQSTTANWQDSVYLSPTPTIALMNDPSMPGLIPPWAGPVITAATLLFVDPYAASRQWGLALDTEYMNYQNAMEQYQKRVAQADQALQNYNTCQSQPCQPDPPPSPGPKGLTPKVNPNDPNALIGPAGYVLPASNLSYTADFENDGTAAAQVVTVTEQLDANLDWSTFQLGSFGFGSINDTVPAGLTQYQTTVSYQNTDGTPLNVLINLDFSVQTGQLTATFTSLDPTTDEAPTGVFDGFLYPNNAAGAGQGFVQYTVQPLAGLDTAVNITQQASVVFDTNPAIATNVLTNPIDAGFPADQLVMQAAKPGDPRRPIHVARQSGTGQRTARSACERDRRAAAHRRPQRRQRIRPLDRVACQWRGDFQALPQPGEQHPLHLLDGQHRRLARRLGQHHRHHHDALQRHRHAGD